MMVMRQCAMIDIGCVFRKQIVVIALDESGMIVMPAVLGMQLRWRMQIAYHQGRYREQKEQ